jgi:translation elongation factor EF-G
METARDELEEYLVLTPGFCVGAVMGELSARGSWIEGLTEEAPLRTIRARIPIAAIAAFEPWLAKITEGQGKVSRVEAANDHDA